MSIEAPPAPATKPPLGVMPEHIHCIRRFDDLARAIYEYRLAGLTPNHEWVNELFRIYAMSFNDPK